MPKHDFFSPKAISNRQKSVGLQKLRWYCQMCQKQCRDENGFQCHIASDGHLRQMRIFGENSGRIISEYSRTFESEYLKTLSHRHGTKRVFANMVYQEYIADKHHVHMNSTCWSSLSGFVQYLGSTGKAIVDETEKGWYIQYIDRDPKTIERQARDASRQKAELDDEERKLRMIEAQIEAARKKEKRRLSDEIKEVEDTNSEVKEEREEEYEESKEKKTISIQLQTSVPSGSTGLGRKKMKILNAFQVEPDEVTYSNNEIKESDSKLVENNEFSLLPPIKSLNGEKELKSEAGHERNDAILLDPPQLKKTTRNITNIISSSSTSPPSISSSTISSSPITPNPTHLSPPPLSPSSSSSFSSSSSSSSPSRNENRFENWLHEGIIVKILNKKLADGAFYQQKGVVKKVIEDFIGEVSVLTAEGKNVKIRVDQNDLETVIPQIDHPVMILNGPARGCQGTLLALHEESFNCSIRIEEGKKDPGPLLGKIIKFDYEDISKLSI